MKPSGVPDGSGVPGQVRLNVGSYAMLVQVYGIPSMLNVFGFCGGQNQGP
jgi:hypothetical protein